MKHSVQAIGAATAILLCILFSGCEENEKTGKTTTTTTATATTTATQKTTTVKETIARTTSQIGEESTTVTSLEATRSTPAQPVPTADELVTTTGTSAYTVITVTSRSSKKTTTATTYAPTTTLVTVWTSVVTRTTATTTMPTTTTTVSPTQSTGNVTDTTAATTVGTTAAVPQSKFEEEVLRLTNSERAAHGLPPFKGGSPAAQSAADIRAVEIATHFSHTRPNGNSCFTALTEAGVSYRRAGENIAKGHRTPTQVVEGWMNSEGHRTNILNADFTHLAVGYADYGWVQLFYTP